MRYRYQVIAPALTITNAGLITADSFTDFLDTLKTRFGADSCTAVHNDEADSVSQQPSR